VPWLIVSLIVSVGVAGDPVIVMPPPPVVQPVSASAAATDATVIPFMKYFIPYSSFVRFIWRTHG
jgi:hypothetical protein